MVAIGKPIADAGSSALDAVKKNPKITAGAAAAVGGGLAVNSLAESGSNESGGSGGSSGGGLFGGLFGANSASTACSSSLSCIVLVLAVVFIMKQSKTM